MQCPTCGNDTPGTLGKCSHCEAPIDVYSVGPAVPLGAPVAEASAGGVPGSADAFGDRTMMVPPPTPSWAPTAQPPVAPDLAMQPQSVRPQSTRPQPMEPLPSLRLSVEPPAPQRPDSVTPAASPLPPSDSEDTAAWAFVPDDDPSGGFGTAPPPPARANEQPALPANERPALPAAGTGSAGAVPSAFGVEPLPEPAESIVPESWFAQPRKPVEPDAEAIQMWGRQPPVTAQPPTMLDAAATQIAPGPMMNPGMPGDQGPGMGFGGDLDQTRMDPRMDQGAHMGAPPPMGQMGQGQMGPGQMGPGPTGPGMPMGPMGQGDPQYGGYPPGQPRPGSGGGTSKPLIAAVATLVTVAVGAVVFVVWPSGDGSPAGADPSPTGSNKQVAQKNAIPTETKQQAATLNKVLNDSVDTRRVLAGALGRAGKCKTLPQAIQGFQTVAQRRQNQLRRTKDLKVDKMANGERLRGSLSQALTASLQVDQVLLQWAQQNQRKCHGKPRPSAAHVPGRAASENRATAAKKQFVVLWNPVAKKTGQPQRSWKRV